jgi:hypothetical protein
VEVVAMDGFTGFKTAAAKDISDRGRGDRPHPRGCAGPATPSTTAAAAFGRPSVAAAAVRTTRSTVPDVDTLHTGADLLTDKQAARLTVLFAIDEHVEVGASYGIPSA